MHLTMYYRYEFVSFAYVQSILSNRVLKTYFVFIIRHIFLFINLQILGTGRCFMYNIHVYIQGVIHVTVCFAKDKI